MICICRCKDDEMTHLYTLIVNPDNTYEVRIDGDKVESGKLEDDWDFLPPKKIKDPEAKKPEDWVDNAKMDNPESVKPEDWDDEEDGEWEPPMINNPEYKVFGFLLSIGKKQVCEKGSRTSSI